MPSGDLRVLQWIPVLALGGLEKVATRLTLTLADRVDRVAVAARTGVAEQWGGPVIEGPLRAAGIPIYPVVRPRPRPDALVRAAFSLVPVLRAERPHVIHAHNPAAGAAAALARRLVAGLGDTPIVTTYHGVRPERVGRAAWALGAASDMVVGVSGSATTALRDAGVPADRSTTVLNAVDVATSRSRAAVRSELQIPDEATIVVTVGRYAPEKNQALLIDALGRLMPGRSDLHALLVGAGSLEGDLRAQASAAGLERVHVTGPRNDAVDIVAASDVFVLTSDSEAFPLALLEAMGLGLPVIATDVGGVRDAVRDGENGVIVPPRDASALADALVALLDDRTAAARLGATAVAFVETNCTVTAMAEAYLELYPRVIQLRRNR